MVCSDFMASRAYAVFWRGVRKAPFNSTMIGIVRCKTWDSFAVAPNFRRPHASPGSMPVAIAPAFDEQTLCPNRRAVGLLFLQEILFGRKIDRLKKPKTGDATCKAGFRSTRRCRSLGSLARACIANNNRIAPSREISGVILMQVPPFADK